MDRSRARAGLQQPHNPAAIGIHRTGTAETSTSSRAGISLFRLDRRAWGNLGAAGLAWFLIIKAAVTGWIALTPLRADIMNNDLIQVYIAATIGRDHGWNHIYSLDLQRDLFLQLRPHAEFTDAAWFISLPPYAWLVLPLTFLSAAAAVFLWLALLSIALVAAWWIAAPGAGPLRTLWLLAAIAWYPVWYGLNLVQPGPLMVLIAAAGWRLAEAKRPYLAGAVLSLALIKPQLVMLVPLVLVVAMRWRVVLPWAVISALVAAWALVSLGATGIHDYATGAAHERLMANNRYFTLAYPFGPGALSYALPALVGAITAVGAYLNRHASLARLFALGIAGSAFAATYWHLQDYTILVLAAWLFWRDSPPAWQRAWLLVVAIAAEVAWPLTPLPILVTVAVWFAFLVAPPAPAAKTAPAAT